MASQGTRVTAATKVVFLDGMGTLIRLLAPALPEKAFRAEAAYYVQHHLEGRDPQSLADLRRRCAAVAGVSPDELMAAIRFAAYPDAAPALRELRALGLGMLVVSNWDYALPDVLAATGLLDLVDDVVASAAVGAAKPDRRIFEEALRRADCAPDRALHVGDSPANDVAGANALGIRAVLLDRRGGGAPGTVGSLAELPALLS
jgi:HAD superfamily hydrolase (TIGR01509 family)